MEGILPAPESSHAILAAVNEAKRCRETGEEKTILFGFSAAPAVWTAPDRPESGSPPPFRP